jgi:hypothetical protein
MTQTKCVFVALNGLDRIGIGLAMSVFYSSDRMKFLNQLFTYVSNVHGVLSTPTAFDSNAPLTPTRGTYLGT